jgi:hypothetical protein
MIKDSTWDRTAPISTRELKRLVEAVKCQHYHIYQSGPGWMGRGCSNCGQTHVTLIAPGQPLQWFLVVEPSQ